MALEPGSKLGPYEVLGPLGAGGMGEVYRARDPKLGRDVAIKVLPEKFAADPERIVRFEREAHALAALNHPGIAAIHGFEEADGVRFLVLELVPGRTLAETLKKRGPLPVPEALGLCTQIAEALAAAHEQGLIHRDLKPSNINVTPDGRAKLLDFGLARAYASAPISEDSPTVTTPATREGVIHGTAAYMSPEQARGEELDRRTDVWSFGCVLFETLTGRRAFPGKTVSDTIVAVLERGPEWEALPQATPVIVRSLLRQCLRKDSVRRLHDIADAGIEIEEALAEPTGTPSAEIEEVRRFERQRWALVFLVTALLAWGVADQMWLRPGPSARPAPVLRGHLDLTADLPLWSPSIVSNHPARTELALSPDGSRLVWTSRLDEDDTQTALHVRRMDTGEVAHVAGTKGASQPFYSPDGRWLGFYVRVQTGQGVEHWLRKIPVEGGLPVDIAELHSWPMGASWAQDGRIFLGSRDSGIQWLPAGGGPPRETTIAESTREAGHRLPAMLPGGQALLFTTRPTLFGGVARIEAFSLASGERKVVVEDGADARYLPTGHLVFVRQGTLMAAPFDLERLELTALPARVVEGVSQALNAGDDWRDSGAAQFATSGSGLLVYASGGVFEDQPVELVLLDEAGRDERLPGFDKRFVSPALQFSPDGRLLAFVEQAPAGGRLWLFDLERQTYRALSDRGIAGTPRWSPDGDRLVIAWSEGGPLQLWELPIRDGEWERLTDDARSSWVPSWGPDGRFLAFVREGPPSYDIFLYRFEDRQVLPFLTTEASETHPEFSPDGRWLAYRSNEHGRNEIFVTSFPDREQTFTVSRQGGSAPAWSRDGRRLFYYSPRSPEGRRSMMTVSVRHQPQLSLGEPTALFQLPEHFLGFRPERSYDLHPDGRRFLIGVAEEPEPTPPITRLNLVHNWHQELRERVPIQ